MVQSTFNGSKNIKIIILNAIVVLIHCWFQAENIIIASIIYIDILK